MYNTDNGVVFSTETSSLISSSAPAEDDDQALLEKIAKREERRQKRMKEALERQKELDPTITDETVTTEDEPSRRNDKLESSQNDISSTETNSWKEKEEIKEEEKEEIKEEEKIEESNVEAEETIAVKEDPMSFTAADEPKESSEKIDKPEEEDRPQRSYLREQVISSTFFAVIPTYDEGSVH